MDEIIQFFDEDFNTTFRRNDDFSKPTLHVENLEFKEVSKKVYNDTPNPILLNAELTSYRTTEVDEENTQCSEICPPEISIQLCPSPEIQYIGLFDQDIDSILNTISQDNSFKSTRSSHT